MSQASSMRALTGKIGTSFKVDPDRLTDSLKHKKENLKIHCSGR